MYVDIVAYQGVQQVSCGSRHGKTASKIISSNCDYKVKFSLEAAEKSTKSSPCTNRPVSCPVCNMILWSCNMYDHYKDKQ